MLRKLSLGLLLMTGLAAGLLSKPVTAAPSMMGITVSISPTGAAAVVGLDRQFTSTVNGTMNTSAVTWAINGVAGGNSTLGTVDSTGHYKAPAVPPPGYIVTLSATSVEDPTVSASTTIYVIWYKPVMAAVNPWSIPLGAFTLSITGSNFVNGAQVLWNGSPLTTSYISSSALNATGNATANATVLITVSNGPGAVSSPAYALVVGTGGSSGNNPPPPPPPPAITVSVSPTSPTVPPNGTQQFTATGTFTDGTTQDVTQSGHWSSTVAGVATISNTAATAGLAATVLRPHKVYSRAAEARQSTTEQIKSTSPGRLWAKCSRWSDCSMR